MVEARLMTAKCCVELGNLGEAIENIEIAERAKPGDAVVLQAKIMIYKKQRNLDKSIETVLHLIQSQTIKQEQLIVDKAFGILLSLVDDVNIKYSFSLQVSKLIFDTALLALPLLTSESLNLKPLGKFIEQLSKSELIDEKSLIDAILVKPEAFDLTADRQDELMFRKVRNMYITLSILIRQR